MSSSQHTTPSVPDEIVPLEGALASVSEVNTDITALVLKLDRNLRGAMDPVGFSHRPKDWRRGVRKVLTSLNQDYRSDVRTDIMRSARKIKQQRGIKYLFERIIEGRQAATRITSILTEIKALRDNNLVRLSTTDVTHLNEHMGKFEWAWELVGEGTAAATHRLEEAKLCLMFLGRSAAEVREDIQFLHHPVPQSANVNAAKPVLALLAQLYEQRVDLAVRASIIATPLCHAICCHRFFVPLSVFHKGLTDMKDIQRQLQAQETAQQSFLDDLQTYLDAAASTPEVLDRLDYPQALPLAQLRNGDAVHKAIIDDMNEVQQIYEPLEESLVHILGFLRKKLAVHEEVV
ncbi:hypothetical protein C2E23DRAFT_879971 [Lenzites betulinus]|nr:hypothetical protein C2E23DRAFT_879971 [Lenzites betulinus]